MLRNRIGPGTKLAEVKLCELFGANREVVRRVLFRLASDGIVEYYPKRGAFVTSPTDVQVAQVRDARIAIETDVAARVADRIDGEDLASLGAITDQQSTYKESGDIDAAVELSNTYHLALAQIGGNPFCVKYLEELTALTCLALAKFEVPASQRCLISEHVDITAALRRHNGAHAAKLMRAHLISVHDAILQHAQRPTVSGDLSSLIVGTDAIDSNWRSRLG